MKVANFLKYIPIILINYVLIFFLVYIISGFLLIKNITTKVWRSTNPSNVVKAAYKGLNSMVDIKNELELRTSTINNNIHSIKEPVSDE